MKKNKTFQKNEYVTVSIDDIGSEGEGIGRIDGFTVFVKDAVVGDTVEAKLVKIKKHYAYARLEKVLLPSPFRVAPACACHRQCGGCQLQALSYEKQLEFKQNKIRNNLIRLGGFDAAFVDERMEPIVGMDEPWHYRNKAQYPVGTDREGNIITGFYAGRTHSIIANTDCLLGVEENQAILETILTYMRKNRVSSYDETTGKGLVRHILIRKGFTSGELMVCLIINADGKRQEYLPNRQELIRSLSAIQGVKSISVSINTEKTNVIMGKEIHTLWGSDTISDVIHVRDMQREGYPFTGKELTFCISPLSFYQVNPVQTEKLYSLALEYAGLTGNETVWDLYCGIGTISLFLAGSAKKVCGVEIIPQAIDDARENAERNNIKNAEFFVGKAEEVLPAFYAGQQTTESSRAPQASGKAAPDQDNQPDMLHPDVIVVDPPRKGCDAICLDTMLKMRPDRIVYVSCDSATLARDLRILHDGGYEIQKIRGVDQFGMTVHVETVCLLSKLHEAKHHVNVRLDMDEMDLTAAESKATYEEIKKYVAEHNDGMRVTNLYIAQVKKKCGIIERENYNKPKSEDEMQPQCPKDKEKAIMEALKAYKMI